MARTLYCIAGIALLAALPLVLTSNYAMALMCQIGVSIVFALSYNLLMGETGMLSFGHAVYYGTGAFTVIHYMAQVNEGQLAFPIAVLPVFGGIAALILGLAFGAVVTRRAGIAFAMITLGLGEVAIAASHMFHGPFGGEAGKSADRTIGPTFAGLDFGPTNELYWLVLAWVLASVGLMYFLTRTPLGRIANAVRDNAERVAYLRFNPRLVRLIMYAFSAFFAGIAGGLSAIIFEIVTFEVFSLNTSSMVVLATFIGGTGNFLGPVLGATLVTWLQSSLSQFTDAWILYLGLFFMFMVSFAPEGLIGLLHKILRPKAGFKRRLLLRQATARAIRLIPFGVGGVAIVELTYRISPISTRSTDFVIAGHHFDAQTPLPWLLSAAMLLLGLVVLLRRPRAAEARAKAKGQRT
ncbi:branched-chain amino acid transport system permease protein [Pseudosulfitobacter pseudonitzschiae]|uniref:Branched-chain amino acid ABC transporter permease n=1 Tax=Pseudosulfitobacter pseudonitzschiae TaxID=1402135 RepID=A0A073IZI2_9RHOB|nr:branched-chain amino acid ABC transporter permease [Pseudosulfitobacter pseudonitzschiae]KEJ94866.1 hypothetical protein SUH3_24105 [Pseudosulfitobacter pseudonitzschiae]QKS07344.1 branched-chain amino acid ABC transporter permease [Pseudosulfitobacter pseudonitzschiae]SHF95479.1 branched-chain amino acid transport system permease protein [Pseudosulfitobacter pseudonitzschiae]